MQCTDESKQPPPPPPPEKAAVEIKKGDKLYCRLLSKESSLTNPSFRVYYTVSSGSVPFLWESRPGTPKNSVPATALPPLTPPPSYQHCSAATPSRIRRHQHQYMTSSSKAGLLLGAFLPMLHSMTIRKPAAADRLQRRRSPTLTSSPSVSSSSSSVFSSSANSPSRGAVRRRRQSRFSSARSSFSSTEVGEEEELEEDSDVANDHSPKSVLCFGGAGYNISMASLKNKLLLFGCGSAQRRRPA